MAERGRGHQVETIGNGRSHYVAEISIVDRERLRQRVVVGEIALVVKTHRVVVCGSLARAAVVLLGPVIHPHEPIIRRGTKGEVGARVVALQMARQPAVVNVGSHTVVRVVKGEDLRAAIVFDVGVGASVIAQCITRAIETIDTKMIRGRASPVAAGGAVVIVIGSEAERYAGRGS